MRPVPRLALLATAAACIAAAPASAAIVTIGSGLTVPATIAETQQQDSAFWANTIAGAQFTVPADGQIRTIRVKGTVLQQDGAGPPLNKVAFQTLRPQPDGSMLVVLSSAPFDLPYTGDPNQISAFSPENLCVKKGDSVAFNDRGGWQFAGTPGNPDALNPAWYPNGASFQIFGAVPSSSTFRFTQHDGTKNGMTLGGATLRQGSELLMQMDLATGDDASEPCGGPRRNADGSLVVTQDQKPEMWIIQGKDGQTAYVTNRRQFNVGFYCESDSGCSGGILLTRTVMGRGRSGRKVPRVETVAKGDISAPANSSGKVALKLSRRMFNWVKSGPDGIRTLDVTLSSTASGKTYSDKIRLKH